MTRLVHALLLGLFGAAIIHIVVLVLVPAYSQRDAWSALSEQANLYRIVRLDPPQGPPLIASLDPLADAVACRFDLRNGVMRLHRYGAVPYWSVSIHDRAGLNVFSLNDNSSQQGRLDLVVATPTQMISLRNTLPEELGQAIFIEADLDEGIAVVRLFTPDQSFEPAASAWLGGIACTLH